MLSSSPLLWFITLGAFWSPPPPSAEAGRKSPGASACPPATRGKCLDIGETERPAAWGAKRPDAETVGARAVMPAPFGATLHFGMPEADFRRRLPTARLEDQPAFSFRRVYRVAGTGPVAEAMFYFDAEGTAPLYEGIFAFRTAAARDAEATRLFGPRPDPSGEWAFARDGVAMRAWTFEAAPTGAPTLVVMARLPGTEYAPD